MSILARADIRASIVRPWSPQHSRTPSQSPPPLINGHGHGHTNGIVSTTCGMEVGPATPPITAEEERMWQDQLLNDQIMRSVEENGIERPKGHRVSFHYNSGVEDMHFGKTHPMKPWRLTLTKHLVLGFGLQYAMDTYEAVPATRREICQFHDPDYVTFLDEVSPANFQDLCIDPRFRHAIPPQLPTDSVQLGPYNLSTSTGADCPVFDGMATYLWLYTGATLAATRQLTTQSTDIAINWSGGLHHAHKSEAAGFCYINDIVLSILDMLRVFPRVLYIDIDVHHGDGVEEAFQRQPRVMTLSFHRYGSYDEHGGKFFPGTGDITDTGLKGTVGERFAQNVPIPSGIDDRQYKYLFENIVSRTVAAYNPAAIVLQCGADSLGGDRLGQFNLNIKQHGECVAFVKRLQLPLLLLGGGGYTARNVARAWTHETALCTDNDLPEQIPMAIIPRPEAFASRVQGEGKMYPSFPHTHRNECRDADLEAMVKKLERDLRYVAMAPWVRMDVLPTENRMMEVVREVQDERRQTGSRGRTARERDPGGRGELR